VTNNVHTAGDRLGDKVGNKVTDNVGHTVAEKLSWETNGRQAAAGKLPRFQVGDTWETSARQTSER